MTSSKSNVSDVQSEEVIGTEKTESVQLQSRAGMSKDHRGWRQGTNKKSSRSSAGKQRNRGVGDIVKTWTSESCPERMYKGKLSRYDNIECQECSFNECEKAGKSRLGGGIAVGSRVTAVKYGGIR
jgi:hypothetical protein